MVAAGSLGKAGSRMLTDQGRRVGLPVGWNPNLKPNSVSPKPRPPSLRPAPQSSVLPTTTQKPAAAPPPGPTPSRSEGQRPLEWLPSLPTASAFQQTWGLGRPPDGTSPETQARPPGPKDNTFSPGTGGRTRPLSSGHSHPPSRLGEPK